MCRWQASLVPFVWVLIKLGQVNFQIEVVFLTLVVGDNFLALSLLLIIWILMSRVDVRCWETTYLFRVLIAHKFIFLLFELSREIVDSFSFNQLGLGWNVVVSWSQLSHSIALWSAITISEGCCRGRSLFRHTFRLLFRSHRILKMLDSLPSNYLLLFVSWLNS